MNLDGLLFSVGLVLKIMVYTMSITASKSVLRFVDGGIHAIPLTIDLGGIFIVGCAVQGLLTL